MNLGTVLLPVLQTTQGKKKMNVAVAVKTPSIINTNPFFKI